MAPKRGKGAPKRACRGTWADWVSAAKTLASNVEFIEFETGEEVQPLLKRAELVLRPAELRASVDVTGSIWRRRSTLHMGKKKPKP